MTYPVHPGPFDPKPPEPEQVARELVEKELCTTAVCSFIGVGKGCHCFDAILAALTAAVAGRDAEVARLKRDLKGLPELIHYFCNDGMSIGNEGDLAGWHPCETALHGLRRGDVGNATVERLRTALTKIERKGRHWIAKSSLMRAHKILDQNDHSVLIHDETGEIAEAALAAEAKEPTP